MKMADLCAELRNYFDYERSFGIFEIKNGSLVVNDLRNGQYFRIIGSVFNDGVYQYPATDLKDEVFDGAIWYMAVPPDVIDLVASMTEWENANVDVLNSPYSSESFGGYSYTKASGTNVAGGDGSITAFSHFADKLKRWRKVRDL
jgi:hypothetical protein